MTIKMFEVRDRATFIPVVAIQLGSDNEAERWLLSRSGFGQSEEEQQQYLLLIRISDQECHYDPFYWKSRRTMREAHLYIRDNFEVLETGAVVDIEYILNESPERKVSERLEVRE